MVVDEATGGDEEGGMLRVVVGELAVELGCNERPETGSGPLGARSEPREMSREVEAGRACLESGAYEGICSPGPG